MLPLKIEIIPKTAFATPLMSDTLWGQFCCSFAERQGSDKLENILVANKKKPFVAFSDGLPAGKIPVPLIEPSVLKEDIEYQKQKKIKKKRFISSESMIGVRSQLTFPRLIKAISKELEKEEKVHFERSRLRTAVNRCSGTSLRGALFEVDETWYSEDSSLDIYCLLNTEIISKSEFEEIVAYIGSNGFGKDSSVGMGRFVIDNIIEDPVELSRINGAEENIFMTLSHGFPSEASELYYGRTMTKFGKHGGDLAVKGRYLKNPVILLEPGSTFRPTEKREVYGRVLTEVSDNPGPHQQSAWMIPFYIKIEEE